MHENPEESNAKMRASRILCASRSVLLFAARMAVNSNLMSLCEAHLCVNRIDNETVNDYNGECVFGNTPSVFTDRVGRVF